LFATKGNYDEGFGKDKLTAKWAPAAAPASSSAVSFVPVDSTDKVDAVKKETPTAIASKFPKASAAEVCHKCQKSVYAFEKIVLDDHETKVSYHKACLRCSHCQVQLVPGNYASMEDKFYCKPHFKQLFAAKGNFEEGFGKEKKAVPAAAVTASANPTPQFVPVESTTDAAPVKKETPSGIASRFKSQAEKCTGCGKTVYATEKIVVEDKEDKKIFHKSCLKCSHCDVRLSLGNYAGMGGRFFCKPHFKQLFATKGNYDEGFGNQKHSAKWLAPNADIEEAPTSTSSSYASTHHEVPIASPEPQPEVEVEAEVTPVEEEEVGAGLASLRQQVEEPEHKSDDEHVHVHAHSDDHEDEDVHEHNGDDHHHHDSDSHEAEPEAEAEPAEEEEASSEESD